ncbi:hypothetical protein ACVJGD_000399 [Bradyrhizobium sp. USDA 10063]
MPVITRLQYNRECAGCDLRSIMAPLSALLPHRKRARRTQGIFAACAISSRNKCLSTNDSTCFSMTRPNARRAIGHPSHSNLLYFSPTICDRISNDTLPTARRNDVKPLRDPLRPHHVVRDTSQERCLGETSQEAGATVGCRTSRQPRHTYRIPVPDRVRRRLLIIHIISRHRPWPGKHRGRPPRGGTLAPRGQGPISPPHPMPLTTASSIQQDRLPSSIEGCKR